jgi:hypothetical protein
MRKRGSDDVKKLLVRGAAVQGDARHGQIDDDEPRLEPPIQNVTILVTEFI